MINLTAPYRRISPEGENWLFGYYDIPSFDTEGRRHLGMRVPFIDRMPGKDDIAELFCIDLETGAYTPIGETTAWCFQQGCFLQWMPSRKDTVIYNVRSDSPCGYGCVIKNIVTGEARTFDRPVATVSADGKYALSINFDRMFDFRPGYGYSSRPDDWINVNHPADDGIYLLDLETGKYKLTISLETLWNLTKDYFEGEDQKVMINHINFNTDGSRFVFLLRNFGGAGKWRTATLTANYDGSDIYVLSDFAMASHYYWVSPEVLSIYSSGHEVGTLGNQLYELTDKTQTGHAVDPEFFLADGHVSYSPDREYILYDSYTTADMHRELYLYDIVTKRGGLMGRFKDMKLSHVDMRCDLHPVWAPDGQSVSIDTFNEGGRSMYLVDVSAARKELRG